MQVFMNVCFLFQHKNDHCQALKPRHSICYLFSPRNEDSMSRINKNYQQVSTRWIFHVKTKFGGSQSSKNSNSSWVSNLPDPQLQPIMQHWETSAIWPSHYVDYARHLSFIQQQAGDTSGQNNHLGEIHHSCKISHSLRVKKEAHPLGVRQPYLQAFNMLSDTG